MTNSQFNFGMIGLGVMGRNFLLNMADHSFKVTGFDKDPQKTAALESSATPGTIVKGVTSLNEMVSLLETPRKIMMLVPAGKPVDDVIEDLLSLVQPGDIIIDGGNSHYTDTLRRVKYLETKKIHFMGMGVSGGEQGARTGPSIMPGGDPVAYPVVKPMLEAVAAKVNGVPCVAHLGKNAAGHYVKMVHNGIEYSIMQLITEVYEMLHKGLGLNNKELHTIFSEWNAGELQSFLVEITADVFLQKDDKTDNSLVDMILDRAGAKGTGKWTSQDAMEIGVPIPSIDMAVTMRNISALKEERVAAETLYHQVKKEISDRTAFIAHLRNALFSGVLISYAQGLALLHKASIEWQMEIPMKEVVRVWRGGCIIRSSLLEAFSKVYNRDEQLPNILLDKEIAGLLSNKLQGLRTVVSRAALNGFAASGLMASLGYIDAYTSGRLPTNLLQAQRDYFGAHTYERVDEPGKFHTDWGTK